MIASGRGLALATAIAVVLAITVAVDGGRTPVVTDRALVPGFDPDRVTELIWERTGEAPFRVVHAAGGWEMGTPPLPDRGPASHVPVDPNAVGEVVAALRGARWHRRGEPTPVHATLTLVAAAARQVLGLGEPVAGTEQSWIVGDGRSMLVDGWVARALDRDRFALMIKAPLAGIRRARSIAITDDTAGHRELRLDGHPRQLAIPARLVIASDITEQLERALAEITIVRLPDGPPAARGFAIATTGDDPPGGVRVVLGGDCPGAPALVALTGAVGDGCVEPAAAAAVGRAIGRVEQPPEAVIERRPIPFEPARVVLADGVALDITTLRVGDGPADQARVAELLAALAAPAEVVRVPATPAVRRLTVSDPAGASVTLDLFAEQVVVRRGEPLALRPAPGAWNLLVRPSRELRDVMLWLEEPTTITAVQIDGVRYERGAVIGDWTRLPGAGAGPPPRGAVDGKALEALVAQLAAPRSLGFVAGDGDGDVQVVHRVIVTVTPPAGAPTEHVLALGAPRGSGCPVRLDHEAILLAATVCAQIAALAR